MSTTMLKALVESNSNSLNPNGLINTRTILEGYFSSLKAKKTIFGNTLFYMKREKAKVQILLGGHYDTVHSEKGVFQKLKKNKNGIWTGPGIADMKGGLVILHQALEAFEKTPEAKNVGWRLFLNGDEEIGSPDSSPHFEAFSKGCQAAFLFEPSLPDGSLVGSRKGSMNLIVSSYGKAAHAGRDLEKGKNALIPLARLIRKLEGTKGLNFGQLNGGEAFNIVPDYAELKINFRANSSQEFERFMKKLNKFTADEGLKILTVSTRPPKPLDAKTKKLIKALNYPSEVKPSGGVCDGNFIASYGIPTVDTLGAVGGGLHTPDEYIDSKSLEARKELFLNFLIRLSKHEITLC